jgi:hypothetical protein
MVLSRQTRSEAPYDAGPSAFLCLVFFDNRIFYGRDTLAAPMRFPRSREAVPALVLIVTGFGYELCFDWFFRCLMGVAVMYLFDALQLRL